MQHDLLDRVLRSGMAPIHCSFRDANGARGGNGDCVRHRVCLARLSASAVSFRRKGEPQFRRDHEEASSHGCRQSDENRDADPAKHQNGRYGDYGVANRPAHLRDVDLGVWRSLEQISLGAPRSSATRSLPLDPLRSLVRVPRSEFSGERPRAAIDPKRIAQALPDGPPFELTWVLQPECYPSFFQASPELGREAWRVAREQIL